ncbi:MAG: TetR family transcriptional regulator [Alphaproteobacteria bacterium]
MGDTDATEATAQRILSAAIEEVRAFGLDRVTVVAVARRASMTHANVYRHYETKETLFDAITSTWLRGVESRLGEIADAPDPARDKLERLIFALLRAYRDRLDDEPRLFDLFVAAFDASRPPARQHRAKIRMLIDRILEEGQSGGAFTLGGREKGLTFVLDALYRFLNPSSLRLDAETPRRSLELRLGVVTTAVLDQLGRRGPRSS